MRKSILLILAALFLLCIAFAVDAGFVIQSNVELLDYTVSEDGSVLTMHVGVMSSAGYVRSYKEERDGRLPLSLTFYATFGGLNSTFGAKDVFTLNLHESDTEIWFNRPDYGCYELVLQKDMETGIWEKPKK